MAVSYTDIKTPLFQRIGENVYRLLLETTTDQVKLADASNLQQELDKLWAALDENTSTYIAADIAARDALKDTEELKAGDKCWVIDASADDTVTKGAALYIVESISGDPATPTWKKISEAESLDTIIKWADIQNKPTSAVADIDDAVTKRHEHTNKAVIDELTEGTTGDGAELIGKLLYKGKPISDGSKWVAYGATIDDMPSDLADGGLFVITGGTGA